MKRLAVSLACEPAISSLIRAALEWCFSLLFHAGSEPPKLLDGKEFQPGQRADSPCIRENLPANGRIGTMETTAQHSSSVCSFACGVGGRFSSDEPPPAICSRSSGLVFSQPGFTNSSRSCFADASDGAPIIRSFGALVHREQHHFA